MLAAGTADLAIDGRKIELESPRLVRKGDVWPLLPAGTKTPPGIKEGTGLLRMDVCATG